jgi:hypothetical protein
MNLNTTVAQLFAPARQPGRVGAEVELITVTGTTRPRPAGPAVLAAGSTRASSAPPPRPSNPAASLS